MGEDERAEWRRMGEQERIRRRSLESLRRVAQEEDVKEKTPKSLLRVVVHADRITVNDAANMLSVSRQVVLDWSGILKNKKLIEIEGEGTLNPTLKPTKELRNRLLLFKQEKKTSVGEKTAKTGLEELEKKKQELVRERESRISMSEELERRDEELKAKEKEVERERNLRVGLEEQMMKLEEQMRGGVKTEIDELKAQLERERKERVRVEEMLRKEREVLVKLRDDAKSRYVKGGGADDNRRSETVSKPIEGVKADVTDISDLINLLAKKKSIRLTDAAKELAVDEKTVSEWTAKLASKKAVRLRRHISGGDEIILENADLKKLKEDLDKEGLEGELRRIMEEEKEVR